MKNLIKYHLSNKHLSMPILSYPSISYLLITVKELLNSSEYQVKGMKYIADNFPSSAALSYMDLSTEAEAFNSTIRFVNDEIPTVIGRVINTPDEINNITLPDINNGRIKTAINTIEKAKKIITNKPIYAGIIGPYSLAGRLMDMTELMMNCYDEPDLIHKLLRLCSDFITKIIIKYKNAGADGIIIAEPAAGLLSPTLCEEFSSNYIKDINSKVNDENFIFIYHNCGNTLPLYQSIIDINADIYHFGNSIDIEKMLKLMPEDKIIMGNIDPILIKNGTPEQIRKTVLELLSRCGHYDNYIISSGCDIPPTAPLINISAYFNSVKEFYNK